MSDVNLPEREIAMIKKKNAFISYFVLALILVFIPLIWHFDGENDALQIVLVVLTFSCILFSRIYKAQTICCPYCHAGKNFHGSMYFHYCEKAIIKGEKEFECPDCGKTIQIK